MRRIVIFLLVIALLSPAQLALAGAEKRAPDGMIVVANRGSGTISVIDVKTDQAFDPIALPEGDNPSEPMYVVYSRPSNRVFVGDRGNNRVVAYNANDFSIDGIVPAGAGVFHMWADPRGRQLWVNNDIDNTITVFNPRSLEVLATVSLPADLVAAGGKPHDVILNRTGQAAFVTMLGFAGDHDYLIKYNTRSFEEVDRAEVGKDPHLAVSFRRPQLYVPAQNSNEVRVLNQRNLELETIIEIPGAHGAWMAPVGVFYTTNLPGGGVDGLFAIDIRHNTVIGEPVDTPYPVPHNLVQAGRAGKLYVTHSGATANKVTIYTVTLRDPVPQYAGEVTVEFNPFGLAYVP